jgi:hypothetical protein
MYNPCCQQLYDQAQVLTAQLRHNTLPSVVANQPAQVAYQRTQENNENLNPLPAACISTLLKHHHMAAKSVVHTSHPLHFRQPVPAAAEWWLYGPDAPTCCWHMLCNTPLHAAHINSTPAGNSGNHMGSLDDPSAIVKSW